jgi:N-glycosylase/DNA lyase
LWRKAKGEAISLLRGDCFVAPSVRDGAPRNDAYFHPEVKKLLSIYKKKKNIIKQRLADFKKIGKQDNKKIFSELCFCLCTPQSKAVNCNEAICRLEDANVLFNGSTKDIARCIRGLVRFHNNKAEYIVAARQKFCNVGARCSVPLHEEPIKIRQWLVKNVKGLGLKEASHFLRNIGKGDNLAIIDRHILTNLKRYGAIKTIPSNISDKMYIRFEKTMQKFSKKIGIPLAELDLLFWSQETGHIFK